MKNRAVKLTIANLLLDVRKVHDIGFLLLTPVRETSQNQAFLNDAKRNDNIHILTDNQILLIIAQMFEISLASFHNIKKHQSQ